METKIISFEKPYLQIKHYPQIITKRESLTPMNYTKNPIIFDKNRELIENKILDKKNITEQELDHPMPLESDYEVKEDIKKNTILKEIKEYQTENDKNKEKIRDKYINFIKIIKKTKVNHDDNKKGQKTERANLNQINNILFKNRFKKKIKEENKNNISEVKPKDKNKDKINKKAQNQLQENKQKNINNPIHKIISKKLIPDESKKNSSSFCLNKKFNFNQFIKQVITITNNKFQKQDKDLNSKKNNMHIYNLYQKDFSDKNPINTNTQSNDNTMASIHKPSLKSCDLNNYNNRSCLIPPYFSRNTQKYYLLSQKNKNSSIINATNSESTKQKNNNNIKNVILNLNNSNENVYKHTYSKGGKFNNIQTTYVISTSKSKSINLNRENKNTILNNDNNKAHYRMRNKPLNEYNNTSNNYHSFEIKSSHRNYETMKSLSRNDIHIFEKNSYKNTLKYYQFNRLRNKLSLPSNKYSNSICNYDYNARNIKNNNLTKRLDQTSYELYNENKFYNQNIYNNISDNNRYWNIPVYDNYMVSNIKSYNDLYNY